MTAQPKDDLELLPDAALVAGVVVGDTDAATIIIRRNNQRLFRAAFSILANRMEAEDAVQTAYLHAFSGIPKLHGKIVRSGQNGQA